MSILPPGPGIYIRPFVRDDQAAARTVILDGLAEHFTHLDLALNPDLDDIAASYLDCGHIFLVATAGATLIGTGGLRITGEAGQTVRVSVARPYRRRGIGRRVVAALLAEAWARGLARVWMETNDDWGDAIGLYRCCGFREFDREDGCIFMEMDLSCNQNAIRA